MACVGTSDCRLACQNMSHMPIRISKQAGKIREEAVAMKAQNKGNGNRTGDPGRGAGNDRASAGMGREVRRDSRRPAPGAGKGMPGKGMPGKGMPGKNAASDNRYGAKYERGCAPQTPDGESREERETGLVIGRNAVRELLSGSRTVDKILVRRGDREGSIVMLVAMAVDRGIPVVEVDHEKLDAIAGFAPHQGIVAMTAQKD